MQRLSIGMTYVWRNRIGHIVGFIHILTQDRILWVDMIAVKHQQKGKGIGRKLVQHALLYGKATRMDDISLYVDKSNNKAIKFYKALGFRSIQYHPNIHCYEFSKKLS